jgi:AcrR family transcriptional regulator
MHDICKEADLSPGAVYRYFPSKESIIQAMCERGGNRNAGAIQDALKQEGTLDVLGHLIETFFIDLDALHSHAECALNVELIAEAPKNEHVRQWLTRNLNEARSMFESLMQTGQARGEIDPALDPESIAQVMVALYHGFITQKLVDPEMDAQKYAMVLRSLFGGTFWRSSKTEGRAADTQASPVLRH